MYPLYPGSGYYEETLSEILAGRAVLAMPEIEFLFVKFYQPKLFAKARYFRSKDSHCTLIRGNSSEHSVQGQPCSQLAEKMKILTPGKDTRNM